MPTFDVIIAEHAVVQADRATTFQAARALDFLTVRTPLLRVAMWFRGVPARWTGKPAPPLSGLVVAEGVGLPGWSLLGEQPNREIAFGAVGKFWQPNVEWRDVPGRVRRLRRTRLGQDRGELLDGTLWRAGDTAQLPVPHRDQRSRLAPAVS